MDEWSNQEAFMREIRVSMIGGRACTPNELYILCKCACMLIY